MKIIINKHFWIVAGIIGMLAACSQQEETKEEVAKTEIPQKELKIKGLSLNNGEKWEANPETAQGIRQMQKILDAYPESSEMNTKQLLDTLNSVKKQIFAQCTMKGEAHNNLHAYLIPLIKKINALKTVKNPQEEEQAIARLKEHLALYDRYFK